MRRLARSALAWLGLAHPPAARQPRLTVRTVRCPVCRGVQPLTRDGTVAKHPGQATRYDLVPVPVPCAGSGRG